ncbi:(2Fe-2S)-binding protein [Streptomyces sp. DSM 44915]|uniref:(2Fe-2S)-binding protein n=1 Tax=Streptomyces chisholmiae TaxID=3075540 RepID=A0ABU2JWS2_9ACTN|nr:(2Fe-2S)-binding protein [Streptomyces sp. DSM 44915]MDT0268954.1 (2Fe-2S)-binding protein [Streptomyces sp. DSM 44915]
MSGDDRQTVGPERLTLYFEGRPVPARPGQTVGGALHAAGVTAWRETRGRGRPRGLFCGIGMCFDCLITVDGRPARRACLEPVADGMRLTAGAPTEIGSVETAGPQETDPREEHHDHPA